MGASLRLGKIFGIPIEIHFTWILIFGLITYLMADMFGRTQPFWPETQRWIAAVVTSVLFFMSVLAHELTHSVVAERWGIPVRKITLFIFGGVSQLAHEAGRPLVEFTIALVGPLSSAILSGIFAGLWFLVRDSHSAFSAVVFILAWVNLSLAVFNMLPGFPLDGGRVLRSAVWGLTGNYWRATQLAASLGQFLGAVMIAGGILLVVFTGQIERAWMVLIGAFLLSAATSAYRQQRENEKLKGYSVGQVMAARWTSLTAPGPSEEHGLEAYHLSGAPHIVPEDTASHALEQMENLGVPRLPVIQNGMVVGIIGRDQIGQLLGRKRSRGFFWTRK